MDDARFPSALLQRVDPRATHVIPVGGSFEVNRISIL
jgi:hypothetical protein